MSKSVDTVNLSENREPAEEKLFWPIIPLIFVKFMSNYSILRFTNGTSMCHYSSQMIETLTTKRNLI